MMDIDFIEPYRLNTAVLFLVFNRPDTTKQVFESIREAKPPRLYVAADGARKTKKDENDKVEAVRDFVLSNVDWECEIKTLFREENLGCRVAVSSAIDWFFENEEIGIILEDDCLPNQSFFRFCEELLEKYKDDTRVMHIGGSNYLDLNIETSYMFSNYTLIWGWATWRRAWKLYDVDMSSFKQFEENNFIDSCFGSEKERRHFMRGFKKMYKNRYNTWDTQWFYTCISSNGLSVIPQKNMIKNIGFGEDATHTMSEEDKHANLNSHEISFPLNHMKIILTRQKFDSLIFKNSFFLSFFTRIKNLAKRFLNV